MSSPHEQEQPETNEGEPRLSSLDVNDEAVQELAMQATQLVNDYFASIADFPVFPNTSAEKIAEQLAQPLPLEGEPLEAIMEDCRTIISASRQNGHPRFYGYIASPSTPAGAYADLIASALNQNVTSWRSAPAATEIEKTVVRWLGSLIGFGEDSHGILTSGGSMANLNALYIALRTRSTGQVSHQGLWNAGPPMTIYTSEQVHSSITKAADILGLGREQVRLVETDANFRLDVRRLRERIEADAANGLRPFCIVASAGTVTTGAVDPLAGIAEIAEQSHLWFHIDGAYGALAMLDQSKHALFEGLARADSISLDPHKWLYTPVDCGCLLFRDWANARAAFNAEEVNYIKVHEQTEDESFAFWDYGIELSRRFRALKVWMLLRYYGARRVMQSISEDNAMAAYMGECVEAADDFELLAPVTLSICCFRHVPEDFRQQLQSADDSEQARLNAALDQFNQRLMHRVQRGGRAYLSNASLNGRFALRACITNFRTTRADIRATLDILRDAARELTPGES